MGPEFTITRDQAREMDAVAIEQYGVKGLILMENAGRACAQAAAGMMSRTSEGSVAVFCGPGNNGGDGFVIARHLTNWRHAARCYLVGSIDEALRKAGDAAVNLEIALNMDIPVAELTGPGSAASAIEEASGGDLIVDALLGTGASGEVREPFRSLIEGINACGVPVLAVDLPSGLDCDTGEPLGVAVRARRTVTFIALKRGLVQPGADQYTGEVQVAEISVPRKALERKRALWSGEEG